MKIFYIILAFFLFAITPACGQKILQMEKRGKVKTKKWYLGDILTFKIKGEKGWIKDEILDIKVEEGIIVFSERFVYVEDIRIIKSYKNARFARSAQASLYTFGAAWLFYSLVGTLTGEPLNDLSWQVPTSSFGLGFLIKQIFYSRKLRIGKKRKLRLLNISFNKDMQLLKF